MNDDELITAVREQRNKVPMTTPVEQIISRGHAVRARRRIPGLAGVLAVVAAAAFAVIALLPASHPASHQPGAQLAAWTVVKQADGTVSVTIRELRDPAGLQQQAPRGRRPGQRQLLRPAEPLVPAIHRGHSPDKQGLHGPVCGRLSRHGHPPLSSPQRRGSGDQPSRPTR